MPLSAIRARVGVGVEVTVVSGELVDVGVEVGPFPPIGSSVGVGVEVEVGVKVGVEVDVGVEVGVKVAVGVGVAVGAVDPVGVALGSEIVNASSWQEIISSPVSAEGVVGAVGATDSCLRLYNLIAVKTATPANTTVAVTTTPVAILLFNLSFILRLLSLAQDKLFCQE